MRGYTSNVPPNIRLETHQLILEKLSIQEHVSIEPESRHEGHPDLKACLMLMRFA